MKRISKRLKWALIANAVFSGTSGATLVVGRAMIATYMGTDNPEIFLWVGVGLLLFAISVFYEAFRKTPNVRQIQFIIYQDWAWVMGSVVILLWQPWDLTARGYWLIAIIAVVVGMFAIMQRSGVKELERT